jgi:hypothetical protein
MSLHRSSWMTLRSFCLLTPDFCLPNPERISRAKPLVSSGSVGRYFADNFVVLAALSALYPTNLELPDIPEQHRVQAIVIEVKTGRPAASVSRKAWWPAA